MADSLNQSEHPPSIRFKLWLKNFLFFLWRRYLFVPDGKRQVILRDSNYLEVRGPGIIHYRKWNETLGPLVHTGPQPKEYTFDNLLSRDVLPVHLRLRAVIIYNPQDTDRKIANSLTKLPKENYPNLAEVYFRWALLTAINQYNATEIARNEVIEAIEDYLYKRVSQEEMKPLGLSTRGKPKILEVKLPDTLSEHHQTLAQRRANIVAAREFDLTDIQRALVTEVIESIGEHGGNSVINFNELLEKSYFARRKAGGDLQNKLTEGQAPDQGSNPQRTSSESDLNLAGSETNEESRI